MGSSVTITVQLKCLVEIADEVWELQTVESKTCVVGVDEDCLSQELDPKDKSIWQQLYKR